MADEYKSSYGKRPLWQWIVIYAVVGIVVYGLVYYFVFAKKGGGYNYNPAPAATPVTTSQATSPAAPATQASQDTVTLSASGFSPQSLTVKAGTKVTWSNQSGSNATVNSDPHPVHTAYPTLNLGAFSNGGTLTLSFDKPGTYGYHNHLNPGQTGTIVVQ